MNDTKKIQLATDKILDHIGKTLSEYDVKSDEAISIVTSVFTTFLKNFIINFVREEKKSAVFAKIITTVEDGYLTEIRRVNGK